MKLTDQDIALFKALSKSQLGQDLADYCERVMDDVCDSRSWGKDDTKESAIQAAGAIRKYFKEKIVTPKKSNQALINESE